MQHPQRSDQPDGYVESNGELCSSPDPGQPRSILRPPASPTGPKGRKVRFAEMDEVAEYTPDADPQPGTLDPRVSQAAAASWAAAAAAVQQQQQQGVQADPASAAQQGAGYPSAYPGYYYNPYAYQYAMQQQQQQQQAWAPPPAAPHMQQPASPAAAMPQPGPPQPGVDPKRVQLLAKSVSITVNPGQQQQQQQHQQQYGHVATPGPGMLGVMSGMVLQPGAPGMVHHAAGYQPMQLSAQEIEQQEEEQGITRVRTSSIRTYQAVHSLAR